MESSTRMRRCLRRNFEGSDHFGAAANYEDPVDPKHGKENAANPSKASILPEEAISMELVNEDDEQDDILNMERKTDDMGQIDDIQMRLSGTAEQPLQGPDSTKSHVGNDEESVSSSAVGVGYIPSEDDERVILELSASMVRPLKVWQGTFQVSFDCHPELAARIYVLTFYILKLATQTFSEKILSQITYQPVIFVKNEFSAPLFRVF